MAITYLGEVTRNAFSAGSIDLTPLGLAADDLVLVLDNCGSNATTRTVGVSTSGYTDVAAKISVNDTYDCNSIAQWKVMGGTPDTSVSVPSTGSTADSRRTTVRAYRGVDTTTPMDVAGVTDTGINGLLPDPPSITPTTSGALIVVCGMGATVVGNTTVFSTPSDLTDFVSNYHNSASFHCLVGVGHKSWTSGAFNPEAWTGPTSNTTDSRASWSIALRPAAGGGSVGSASGTSTVSATGQATVAATASASGAATATATGAATVASVAASAGTATAAATGSATVDSIAASAGIGSASAVGAAGVSAVGVAAGTSVAAAVGGVSGGSTASASGTSTASSAGAAVVSAAASASGASGAAGSGIAVIGAVAASAGAALAGGIGAAIHAAIAISGGVASASGVMVASANGVASAIGQAVAAATGASTGGVTPPRRFAFPGDTANGGALAQSRNGGTISRG